MRQVLYRKYNTQKEIHQKWAVRRFHGFKYNPCSPALFFSTTIPWLLTPITLWRMCFGLRSLASKTPSRDWRPKTVCKLIRVFILETELFLSRFRASLLMLTVLVSLTSISGPRVSGLIPSSGLNGIQEPHRWRCCASCSTTQNSRSKSKCIRFFSNVQSLSKVWKHN